MVILYFSCLALLWGGIAVTALTPNSAGVSIDVANNVYTKLLDTTGVVALAFHAATIVLLASPESGYTTGATYDVNGGIRMD